VDFTRVKEIHASAKMKVRSHMNFTNDYILMTQNGYPYLLDQTQEDIVRKIVNAIN
jgi:hypothetical protein